MHDNPKTVLLDMREYFNKFNFEVDQNLILAGSAIAKGPNPTLTQTET